MPLRLGRSKETIARNIAEMLRAGRPRDQAIAAAYRQARTKPVKLGKRKP